MFQPKLRRALVSAALVSTLSLPAHAAAPRSQKPQQTRSERNVAVQIVAAPFWDLVNRLMGKSGIRIDPDGHKHNMRVDSDGDVPSGSPSGSQ